MLTKLVSVIILLERMRGKTFWSKNRRGPCMNKYLANNIKMKIQLQFDLFLLLLVRLFINLLTTVHSI